MTDRHRDPTYRCCLSLIRLMSALVPADRRHGWRLEWEGELHEFWDRLSRRRNGRRARAPMVRRTLSAGIDAAWLRRQVTRDADLVHDVRHGLRLLRRTPGMASVATVVFALAIGSATAVFSLIDILLIRPLPYADPDRLVTLWQRSLDDGGDGEVSPANFLDLRERATSFASLAAADPVSFDYLGGAEPETLRAATVTEDFFQTFGVRMQLGRPFDAREHHAGADRVVVLSHGCWKERFGGDPAIVGRTVTLDGAGHQVVGVLPPSFQPMLLGDGRERAVWAPKVPNEFERRARGGGYWAVVGRLRPEIQVEAAQAELQALSATLASEYPRTNRGIVVVALPIRDHLVGPVRTALGLVGAAVAIILLIACANVANLLLASGSARRHELVVRMALGAARGRLVRQMLAESLLLASAGAIAGLALAHWTLRVIVASQPGEVPGLHQVSLNLRVVLFACVATLVSCGLAGLGPALAVARRHSGTIGSRMTTTAGERRVQRGLVVVQVALSLVLLVGSALLTRSFVRLLAVDPGFRSERILTLQVFTYGERYRSPQQRTAFYQQALDGIRTLPAVQVAGLASAMPFGDANINIDSPLTIEGRPEPPAGDAPGTFVNITTADYFRAMQIPLIEGRLFTDDDRYDGSKVCLISEGLARRHFPAGDAVGSIVSVMFSGRPVRAEIVGVVGQVRHDGLDRSSRPEVFLPHGQVPFGSMTFVVKARADASSIVADVKREIWRLDPRLPFYDVAIADQRVQRSVSPRRFSLMLLSGFALMAFVVCAIGIYGMVSFAMMRRTREIGVRLTLGARPFDIHRMVVGEGTRLAALGIVAGAAAALLLATRWRSLLFEISPADPMSLLVASVLLMGVAAFAAWLPARRATRRDPLEALRSE